MGFTEMFKMQPMWAQELEEHLLSGFLIGFGGALTNQIAGVVNIEAIEAGLVVALTLGLKSALQSMGGYFMSLGSKGTAAGPVERRKLMF